MARPPHVPQSETELEEFFDLSIDPLSIIGFDGEFKRVNASFVRLLGYSKSELLSRSALDITHPDDVERAREALAQLAEGHDVVRFEGRVICADGSVRWLEWSTRSMPERGVVYCVGRDATERRSADAEARADASRLAEEQAALRRVATLVAHESSPSEVAAAVAKEVAGLLGVENMRMARYEADATVTVVAQWGEPGAAFPVGSRLPLGGENIASQVLTTERPARIESEKATGAVGAYVRSMGSRTAVGAPIVVDGRVWGVLVATSPKGGSLPADTESRLENFTELVATAISNTEARTELAASRARIVAATDDERRRVVRDLHDGAQQRLVHTIITLRRALETLENEEETGPALVSEALDEAEQAMAELRELAHGILPGVLKHGGLRAGVHALASRMPVPVENNVSVNRLPAAVEATAYFVVAEALTNVAKHAGAASAAVAARVEDGTLRVEVRDDGVGGARPDGSGLQGLSDRLAVHDGRLRIESPADGGTLVTATIPIPASAIER